MTGFDSHGQVLWCHYCWHWLLWIPCVHLYTGPTLLKYLAGRPGQDGSVGEKNWLFPSLSLRFPSLFALLSAPCPPLHCAHAHFACPRHRIQSPVPHCAQLEWASLRQCLALDLKSYEPFWDFFELFWAAFSLGSPRLLRCSHVSGIWLVVHFKRMREGERERE